jgi:hypothetical protein
VVNGTVIVDRAGFAGAVLLQADNGLFAARTENGGVSVERAGNAEMGRVSAKRDFPGGEGVLISVAKGRFLARVEQGAGAR